MNLLIDIDGVVAEYNIPQRIKEVTGANITLEDIWSHELVECLGLPEKTWCTIFENINKEPANIVHGARETLSYLVNKGHKIYIYTNRAFRYDPVDVEKWLYINKIPHYKLMTIKDVTEYQEFHVHIDDSPNKLLSCPWFAHQKLLYTRPWNIQCKNILNLMYRVNNWKEIRRYIDGMANSPR